MVRRAVRRAHGSPPVPGAGAVVLGSQLVIVVRADGIAGRAGTVAEGSTGLADDWITAQLEARIRTGRRWAEADGADAF